MQRNSSILFLKQGMLLVGVVSVRVVEYMQTVKELFNLETAAVLFLNTKAEFKIYPD